MRVVTAMERARIVRGIRIGSGVEWRQPMTTLEYMKQQETKHRLNFIREWNRGAPEDVLSNIQKKIKHYMKAVQALEKVGDDG
jgi:predicted secreted protein